MPSQAYTNTYSRVWFQEGGPGPARGRDYFGHWKAGSLAWSLGDLTTIRQPDPDQYGKFIRVGRYRGEPGDPELPVMARYTLDRSRLLKAARGGCEHAVHVHMGRCANPQDFHRGWEKAIIIEGASINNYGTEDLGALGPDEESAVNEEVTFVGTDLYEVTRLTFSETGGALVTREVTDVYFCDSAQCAACGLGSDGCQVILALEGGVTASPGQAPTVIYSRDGGATWAERTVATLASNQAGSAIFCAGSYVVVASADDNAFHYIALTDLLAGTGSWTEVNTGFVSAAAAPLSVHALGASEIWVAGEAGTIYFSDDITVGVTVSTNGGVTVQDLNDIHAFDSLNIVAVGASNAVLRTTNGGTSWALVVGPAVGVVLNAVWMMSALEWYVGSAAGRLYYTTDGGASWVERTFPGSGAGVIRDIKFATPSVGYLAHNTATPAGRVLRTIDGGYSWYVLPEDAGNIPANDYVKAIAICDDPNVIVGGGLGDNAVDGFLVKAA